MRKIFTFKLLLIVIQLIILIKPVFSQMVKGMVMDEVGEPVVGAHILSKSDSQLAITDAAGWFQLDSINMIPDSLVVTALSYKTSVHYISAADTILKVVLKPASISFPEVLILGKSDRLLSHVPGAAGYIGQKEINRINPLSGNEVLRRTAGVHVSDEEGVGLRANIGVRGLDPDRSRNILVLEDGIPVALAPYGEPEMYYTPPIDRMSGVEILKGSGQILYGPQTIGGVLNYTTKAPPAEREMSLKWQGGQGGYYNFLSQYGNTFGNTGVLVSVLHKGADNIGMTAFKLTDIMAKLAVTISDRSSFLMKAGYYNEFSNATYLGLTQTMYDAGGQDFVRMAPDDQLAIRRYNASLIHDYKFKPGLSLKTSVFVYTTSRNWRRQDFVSNYNGNSKPSNWTGVVWGDENVPGGAVYMRNSTGNRNRQFEVAGVQTGLKGRHSFLGKQHDWQVGVRFLYEKADEQRINGSRYNAISGALAEDEDRPASAVSVWLQQASQILPGFSVHYGLRAEHFTYERQIFRRSFFLAGQTQLRDTLIVSGHRIAVLIPGAGFTYQPSRSFAVFGGIHKGFAPPRTKDAISDTGIVYELDAEQSTNAELGFRTEALKGLRWEITAYHMDFSNQIIPVSESSGGAGSGLVNGGRTLHRGIETALRVDVSQMMAIKNLNLLVDVNANFSDAEFKGERSIDGVAIYGNRTPYAPVWLLNASITLELNEGPGMRLGYNYTGNQYSDERNTLEASPDGRIGLIPSFYTIDANLFWNVQKIRTTFQLNLKNITDESYITSRRPQGIKVGLPGWVGFSVEHRF